MVFLVWLWNCITLHLTIITENYFVDSKKSVDDLEAELEADLDDLKLDDIDTTDVNLDDEELLED